MRRRMYFMLPDVASARTMLDELLLARIAERHIHFCAKDGALPPDMPEVTSFQKTDIVHGVETGMLIGGVAGLIAGSLLLFFPIDIMSQRAMAWVLACVAGGLFGGWASAKAARAIPNSRIQPFRAGIEEGQVLLLVDVPYRRITEIEELVLKRHPAARCGGMEHLIPLLS